MSSYLSASWIYPVSSAPLKDGVIAVSADGTISAILTAEQAHSLQLTGITYYEGVIVPGFINTHCHLELSHLAGKIPEHTGLPGFVQHVMQQREADAGSITAAMVTADAEMYANGIVAVGDISNQLISKDVKINSHIYYHTFVEAMGFNPARATEIIDKAKDLRGAFAPLKATIVPHAPYSVSADLFAGISSESGAAEESISIHNQETAAENAFFETKTSHFLKLYEYLNLDISFFTTIGKTSLQTYLPLMPALPRTLLVHNTFTSEADIRFALSTHQHLFWCLCPNANMYIENRLPDVMLMMNQELTITLGTDSLASNHQLSILAEMYILQQHLDIPFEVLLRWATLNGAAFLGLENLFGSLQPGRKPGIILIEFLNYGEGNNNPLIDNNARIKRLF